MLRVVAAARRARLAAVLVGLASSGALGGCSRGGQANGAMPRFHEAVVAKLKRAGFAVRNVAIASADPYGARQCVRGEAERLEVLLCDYRSPEDARSAQQKLSRFAEGAVTGAARSSGAVGMAVADRHKVDVKGKRIARLLKAFEGKDVAAGHAAASRHPR
jgi:hypothetical protein